MSTRSLKPGGWIELQEADAIPLCDDGTMLPTDPVAHMYDLGIKSFQTFGMDMLMASKFEPLLRQAGFENVHCTIKKVPIGVWAKDKTLRLIGLYQKLTLLDFMPALAGRPFQALGMSPTEIEVTLALARRGLDDTKVHRYFKYFFWYAQKPKSK